MLLLKNLLFTILVPGTVAVYIPLQALGGLVRIRAMPWRAVQYLSLIPVVLGVALYAWCVWNFAVVGRGTPAPVDAPKVLVTLGPYRHLRNPMYLGVLLVVLGEALLASSRSILLYSGILSLFFQLFVLLVEEPVLRRQFGTSYEDYCTAVRRWVPGRRGVATATMVKRR